MGTVVENPPFTTGVGGGTGVGVTVGVQVGTKVFVAEGSAVGEAVADGVGLAVGDGVRVGVGVNVGSEVWVGKGEGESVIATSESVLAGATGVTVLSIDTIRSCCSV